MGGGEGQKSPHKVTPIIWMAPRIGNSNFKAGLLRSQRLHTLLPCTTLLKFSIVELEHLFNDKSDQGRDDSHHDYKEGHYDVLVGDSAYGCRRLARSPVMFTEFPWFKSSIKMIIKSLKELKNWKSQVRWKNQCD